MVAYDHAYPKPVNMLRPILAAFGVAFILTPRKSDKSLAMIEVDFLLGTGSETTMKMTELEALRCGVPAARALPLLLALAGGADTSIDIAYFDKNHLHIRISPC